MAQQVAATPIAGIPEEEQTLRERELFAEVEEIRAFAAQELGLALGDSYTTYYRTDRDHLVDVVSAAREFSFERKEWWFPIFGRFPYKGFYRREPAEGLARRLDARGWDVILRPVDAFSTLGYFKDPVVSFMADYPVARLAEIIIHESAHATLWLRSESQFNEEFATFVGRVGAERYLVDRYGADSPELRELRSRRRDQERFRTDVLELKEQLRVLYAEPGENSLRAAKAELIDSYQQEFARRYDGRYETEIYRFFSDITVNNAYLDLFDTYSGTIDRFYRFHAREGGGRLETTVAEILRKASAWERLPRRERPPVITLLDD
ncbi:MAG: aminopeptidase [Alkalispirochaeta sp.]